MHASVLAPEWADLLVASIRFEVFDLDAIDATMAASIRLLLLHLAALGIKNREGEAEIRRSYFLHAQGCPRKIPLSGKQDCGCTLNSNASK